MHPTSSAEYIVGEIKRHMWAAVVVLATLLVAVAGITYFNYSGRSGEAAINSVAVLPFANVGGDPDAEYLSDGITESLINSLSRLPQLKVIARSSVFQYKGKEADPQAVGRELGVQGVLSGRVVQRGDSVSVSVEFVDARDKSHLWGERYSRKSSDLPALQEELARDISEKLRARLMGAVQSQVAKRHTSNSEAYNLYLRGLFFKNKQTPDAAKEAVNYLERAVALDSNYALAYAELANTYLMLGSYGFLDPKEAFPKAKAAALRALEIDDTLAEAHAELAQIKLFTELNAADPELEKMYIRAIEMNPNLARAHTAYANFLTHTVRLDEALIEIRRAQDLDPLSLRVNNNLALILDGARRTDEAIEQYKRTLEMDPGYTTARYNLALVYKHKGMYKEAIAEYQKVIEVEGTADLGVLAMLGSVYAVSGNRGEAEKLLARIRSTKQYVSPLDMAILFISLDDKEQALAWLRKGYEERDNQLIQIKFYRDLDPLRSDPRFQDLLRRMGLPP